MGTFKNLDRLLDSFTQGSIPGCACVVMQNHDILYESYSGFADNRKRGLKSTNVPFSARRPQQNCLLMPSA